MFNVTEWILQAAKLKTWLLELEGNKFELINLTDELIDEASESESSKELLEFCAVSGLCANGVRALDIEGMTTEKLDKLWDLPDVNTGSEPSIYHSVGLEVVKESGLECFYDELIEKENPPVERDESAAIAIVDGDNLTDDQLSQTVEQFQSQAS